MTAPSGQDTFARSSAEIRAVHLARDSRQSDERLVGRCAIRDFRAHPPRLQSLSRAVGRRGHRLDPRREEAVPACDRDVGYSVSLIQRCDSELETRPW
jgi:hypothetical protein